MPPPLISLPPELLCNILKKLPFKAGRELMASCRKIYDNGKPAFDQKCFKVIPLSLEDKSMLQAEELTKKQPCCFLEEIVIRIDRECDRHPGKLHFEDRLLSIFTNARQLSTKFNAITIHYDPEEFDSRVGRYRAHTKAVVFAIKTFLEGHESTNFKIGIQSIRLHDCATLFALGKSFLNRVQSLGLRLEPYDTRLRFIQEFLPLATNLKEISLMNDTGETLPSNHIRKATKAISSANLKSISIAGIDTTNYKLQKILRPFKASLQKIKLRQIMFEQESFDSFVDHISRNYSIEDFDLEEIWETDGKKESEVIDPMSHWYDLQATPPPS
ncbi:hypothetical protein BKA64DRAFT_635816 [Cadophora sp. MPI-SDFR-AT-0126]|nr:hypothetical protein BKA64DRAFT_635816 [Leotiomycetes sp. MPI-SDFR-AT-0126]